MRLTRGLLTTTLFLTSVATALGQSTPALTITPTVLPDGQIGQFYGATLVASISCLCQQPSFDWSINNLPDGLVFTVNTASGNVSTATITGVPITPYPNGFSITASVAVPGVASGSETYLIRILPPTIQIGPATLPVAAVGAPYSALLTGTGGAPPYTWSIVGVNNSGLSINSSTGALGGTPLNPGTFPLLVQATDSIGQQGSQLFRLAVSPELRVVSTTLPTGAVGVAYSTVLQAAGGQAVYHWSVINGSLPPGLQLDRAGGNCCGFITGTPTTNGTYPFTVQVTDFGQRTAQGNVVLTIGSGLTITTTSLPAGVVGAAYSQVLAATGGLAPYSWSIAAGNLPPGLALDPPSGTVSGTPITAGSPTFTVQVSDSAGSTAKQVLTLNVASSSQGLDAFLLHNLVSDLPGLADKTDANLKNPWGNAFSATGPFWIGDNATGLSTLYDGTGTPSSTVVSIPAAGGAATGGPVTGVILNSFSSNTSVLNVAAGKPASFLFCSEDGIISGWASSVDATHAKVLVDNSGAGARYKGCALTGTSSAPVILAANFNSGNIDVFDGSFNPVTNANTFVDPGVPLGFAPFNIEIINGNVYVAYAKQDSQKHDDSPGPGNGFVSVFTPSGALVSHLIDHGVLNSPWGMAMAPATFGPFGGDLLVANFGNGKINAFNPITGQYLGTLNDLAGNPIVLAGLWSIHFGPARNADAGTLYVTAGIGGGPANDPPQTHGLLASIQASPSFNTSGIVNNGSQVAGPIAPNTWITIKGAGMSATSATWTVTGSTLPINLNGVGVTVNGEAAPVASVTSSSITFLVPADIVPSGNAQIVTTNNGLTSASAAVPVAALAPSFFTLGTVAGVTYIAATHADNSPVGPTTLISGKSTPAKAGETIAIYGTGFGLTNGTIPNGQILTAPLTLPAPPAISVGTIPARVTYAGLVGPGLYQFNVIVPAGVPSGDAAVVGTLGIGQTQPGAFTSIQ